MSFWDILPQEIQDKIARYAILKDVKEEAIKRICARDEIQRCNLCHVYPARDDGICSPCAEANSPEPPANIRAILADMDTPADDATSVFIDIEYQTLIDMSKYYREYGMSYCMICTRRSRDYIVSTSEDGDLCICHDCTEKNSIVTMNYFGYDKYGVFRCYCTGFDLRGE